MITARKPLLRGFLTQLLLILSSSTNDCWTVVRAVGRVAALRCTNTVCVSNFDTDGPRCPVTIASNRRYRFQVLSNVKVPVSGPPSSARNVRPSPFAYDVNARVSGDVHLVSNVCAMDTVGIEYMSQIQEGQLYKYTNVVKGWQHRWFILDPREGTLSYFLVNICIFIYVILESL